MATAQTNETLSYRFTAVAIDSFQPPSTAETGPESPSAAAAFKISTALSRQKRALAGRFKARYSANASSVRSGLLRNALIVICSLSGLLSPDTASRDGFEVRSAESVSLSFPTVTN